MKTLIGKYKELVELQDKLTDILLSGWNNEDNQTLYPEDLERKIEKIESEIAELEQQNNPALREELIKFVKHYFYEEQFGDNGSPEKLVDEYLSSRQEKPNAKEI